MRRQRKQDLYRKEEFKRAVIEWTLGILSCHFCCRCCNFAYFIIGVDIRGSGDVVFGLVYVHKQ